MTNGSAMIEPTVLRGFSDEYGSWKIICISRRRSFRARVLRWAISSPLNLIEPEVGAMSRNSSRAVVDLPQPDSPTRPSVSPRRTSNEMPSTAPVPGRPRRWREHRSCRALLDDVVAGRRRRHPGLELLPQPLARTRFEQARDLVVDLAFDRLEVRVDPGVRLAHVGTARVERA